MGAGTSVRYDGPGEAAEAGLFLLLGALARAGDVAQAYDGRRASRADDIQRASVIPLRLVRSSAACIVSAVAGR
jgi:hypothetical protein